MKKIISLCFILFVVIVKAQNTIPTTTVNGSLNVNSETRMLDTVRASKDIKVAGNAIIDGNIRGKKNLHIKKDITAKGEIISQDTLRAEKDILVGGNANIDGNLKVNNNVELKKGFTFDGSKGISFTPSTSNTSNKFHYGNKVLNIPEACAAAPQAWANHQFGGIMQIYDADASGNYVANSGLLNFQTWSGGSSIDASIGGVNNNGVLLLNWFCGNDVSICQGTYGGIVKMGKK